jgi:hypothetical protein
MKRLTLRLGLAAACVVLTMVGRATSAFAAEPDQSGPGDRLERLERRVNEMAQRQEQLMHRLGAPQQERQAPMAAAGPENMRQARPMRDRARMGQPMPPVGAPALAGLPLPAGLPPHGAQAHKDIAGLITLCCLVAAVFNILAAIWIFTDIRKRGEGSGIFIALALLAGVPAAIIYAIVRIGDKKA